MFRNIKGKYLEHRWEITVLLIISSSYAAILEILRIWMSGHRNYFYLLWNLFLAWIPYVLSMYVPVSYHVIRSKVVVWLLFITWLLFWPNSPYMLTDLLHLREKQNIPLWFDLVLILSFSWTGLILGFISLIEIHNFIRKRTNRLIAWVFAVFIILMGSLGIYIGRYVRLNSWEILSNPVRVYTEIVIHFKDIIQRSDMIGMTLLYGFFLFIGYLTVKIIIKIPDRMAL